jgi:hypothetical protein
VWREATKFPKQGFSNGTFDKWFHKATLCIVVTYKIRVFFEGAEKEVFSSIFFKKL